MPSGLMSRRGSGQYQGNDRGRTWLYRKERGNFRTGDLLHFQGTRPDAGRPDRRRMQRLPRMRKERRRIKEKCDCTRPEDVVGDFTYQQLQQFYLKDASGNITKERIPTLEEAMKKGKGKVYYNLDIVNKNVAVNTIVALLKKLDMEGSTLLYVSNNRNYAFDLKTANSSLLLHPMAKAADDITYFFIHK